MMPGGPAADGLRAGGFQPWQQDHGGGHGRPEPVPNLPAALGTARRPAPRRPDDRAGRRRRRHPLRPGSCPASPPWRDRSAARTRAVESEDLPEKDGAGEGTRTPDPIITNDVLYQLSYTGILLCHGPAKALAVTRQARCRRAAVVIPGAHLRPANDVPCQPGCGGPFPAVVPSRCASAGGPAAGAGWGGQAGRGGGGRCRVV